MELRKQMSQVTENADTLLDYVSSAKNKDLIQFYAMKHLSKEYTHVKSHLENAIQFHLDQAIEDTIQQNRFETWSLSPTNLAEINIFVWQRLKVLVKKTLDHVERPIEDQYKDWFQHRQREVAAANESSEDVKDREPTSFLQERYANTWNHK